MRKGKTNFWTHKLSMSESEAAKSKTKYVLRIIPSIPQSHSHTILKKSNLDTVDIERPCHAQLTFEIHETYKR